MEGEDSGRVSPNPEESDHAQVEVASVASEDVPALRKDDQDENRRDRAEGPQLVKSQAGCDQGHKEGTDGGSPDRSAQRRPFRDVLRVKVLAGRVRRPGNSEIFCCLDRIGTITLHMVLACTLTSPSRRTTRAPTRTAYRMM